MVLKEAEQAWSGTDCADLADLAEEIHGYIGWPASKKKQARKNLIADHPRKSLKHQPAYISRGWILRASRPKIH